MIASSQSQCKLFPGGQFYSKQRDADRGELDDHILSQYLIAMGEPIVKTRSSSKTNWHHEGITTSDFGSVKDVIKV